MEKILLKNYGEVYLEDQGEGKGKIVISLHNGNSYSYYWGAMGSSLKDFIVSINKDYFSGKLIPHERMYVFSAKQSVRAVRKYIRTEMSYDLPWYEYMSGQKELRVILKEIEKTCETEYEFVSKMESISGYLMCLDMDYNDEKDFKIILKSHLEVEPWNFIAKDTSNEYKVLCKVHGELVKTLSK